MKRRSSPVSVLELGRRPPNYDRQDDRRLSLRHLSVISKSIFFVWHFYFEFLTIIWTEGGDWPEAQDRHQAPSLSISVMRETLTPRYSSMWAARGSRSSGTLSASSRDLAWVVFMTAVAALRCLKSVIGQSEKSLVISSQRLMLDTFWLKANSSLTALRATSSPSWTSTGRDSCTWWKGSVWRHFLKSWPTGD